MEQCRKICRLKYFSMRYSVSYTAWPADSWLPLEKYLRHYICQCFHAVALHQCKCNNITVAASQRGWHPIGLRASSLPASAVAGRCSWCHSALTLTQLHLMCAHMSQPPPPAPWSSHLWLSSMEEMMHGHGGFRWGGGCVYIISVCRCVSVLSLQQINMHLCR